MTISSSRLDAHQSMTALGARWSRENRLSRTSSRSGAPAGALAVILAVAIVALLAYRIHGACC